MLVSKPKGYVEPKPEVSTDRKVVDVFAQGAPTGKASKLNPDEDAWQRIAPPPQGRYSLQLFPSENIVTQNENKKGEFESYSINIMFKVVNSTEDFNDATGFATVNTRIGRGKDISTAAGLLIKLGYKIDPGKEYTDLQMAKNVVIALKKEPIINNCLCDWKASYEYNGKWINVFNTYEDFPIDAEGERIHNPVITKRDGSRDEILAKFFIKEWGGKGVKVEEVPVVVVEEQQEEKPATAPIVAKAKVNGKVTPAKKKEPEPEPEPEPQDDEDEELMLA